MKKKLIKVLSVLLIASLILSACGKKEENEQIEKNTLTTNQETEEEKTLHIIKETEEEEKETEAESEPAGDTYSKFSGMPITAEDNNKRPITVMLDNHPDARMQAGLRDADMVFEMVVEGTYTRYMALFHSNHSDNIGPIRSARKYFVDRMLEYDAIYTHFGSSSEAEAYIAQNGYEDIDGMIVGSNTIWRDNSTGKIAPHNAYSNYDSLKNYADAAGYPEDTDVQGFAFNQKVEVLNGEKADTVSVSYFSDNNSKFDFQEDTQTYTYIKDGMEQVDEKDQLPLEIRNIIIQTVNYYPNPNFDGILSQDNIGEGEGYLISNGEYLPITWQKIDKSSQTLYFYNGEEIKLNPGQTWVLLASANTVVTIE